MAKPQGWSDLEVVRLNDGTVIPSEFDVECRWLTTNLAISGMIGTRRNLALIAQLGLTHVIGLQAEFDDRPLAQGLPMTVTWIPLDEVWWPFPAEAVATAIEIGRRFLAQPTVRLLVHCMAGRTRAPVVAYGILRSTGLSRDECKQRIYGSEPAAQLDEARIDAVEAILRDPGTVA